MTKKSSALTKVPASGAPPSKQTQKILRSLEEAAGGREELIRVLQHAEQDSDEDLLVRALADPRNDAHNLANVCAQAGFSVAKFIVFLRKGKGAEALLKAMDKVYEYTPQLADDVMKGAINKKVKCQACRASGNIAGPDGSPILCTECWGDGWVDREPDLERQKVALQIAGLIKGPGGGVNVQVNQGVQVGGGSMIRTSTEFRQATDKLLFPAREERTVEAEIIRKADEDAPS